MLETCIKVKSTARLSEQSSIPSSHYDMERLSNALTWCDGMRGPKLTRTQSVTCSCSRHMRRAGFTALALLSLLSLQCLHRRVCVHRS